MAELWPDLVSPFLNWANPRWLTRAQGGNQEINPHYTQLSRSYYLIMLSMVQKVHLVLIILSLYGKWIIVWAEWWFKPGVGKCLLKGPNIKILGSLGLLVSTTTIRHGHCETERQREDIAVCPSTLWPLESEFYLIFMCHRILLLKIFFQSFIKCKTILSSRDQQKQAAYWLCATGVVCWPQLHSAIFALTLWGLHVDPPTSSLFWSICRSWV